MNVTLKFDSGLLYGQRMGTLLLNKKEFGG